MSAPRLAIVTTVYGHAHFLGECFASVAAQTSQDFAHIIVDDASPDGAWPIIERYARTHPNRIALKLDANRGLAGAFNAGVAMLPESVEWILKCDADDTMHPEYIADILAAADEDLARNVIFSPCQFFGTRTDVYRYPAFDAAKMRQEFYIPGPAAYKRALFDAVAGYDETMRSAEDWDLYIRAQLVVGLIPHQLAEPRWNYRQHAGPRASHEGIKRLRYLQAYWQGHTRETAIARSRTWGAWCAERELAA